MAQDDDAGASSDSSEDSDGSADVHMSTSDEEASEDGNAEEVNHWCWLCCEPVQATSCSRGSGDQRLTV